MLALDPLLNDLSLEAVLIVLLKVSAPEPDFSSATFVTAIQTAVPATSTVAPAARTSCVTAIRNARSDAGIDASTWLAATIVPRTDALRDVLQPLDEAIARLARVRVAVTDSPANELGDGS